MVARHTRNSSTFPGLSYEMTAGRRPGEIFVTFTHGAAWDTYLLADGRAYWVECSDKATLPGNALAHCRRFADQAAAKMTGRKMTGKAAGQGWAA